MRLVVANAALKVAKENYYTKYDTLIEKMQKDYVTIAGRIADIAGENSKDVRREIARQACVNIADLTTLPKSPDPPKGWGSWFLIGVAIAAAVVASVFTAGAAGAITIAALSVAKTAATAGVMFAATVAATVTGAVEGSKEVEHAQSSFGAAKLAGHSTLEQWNYRETVDTNFDWQNLICHKCVTKTTCEVTRNPWIGNKHCAKWAAEGKTECKDIKF